MSPSARQALVDACELDSTAHLPEILRSYAANATELAQLEADAATLRARLRV